MAPRPLMVADMVSASGDWDWVRLRELLPQHLLEQIAVEVLPHYEASPDIPSWRLEDRRVFTMKSAYDHIRVHNVVDGIADPCWKRVWKLQVPQRVRFFLWLALHRRLLTNVERIRRHLTSMDRCECCLDGPEDMIHVLRDCFVARDLWSGHGSSQFFAGYCGRTDAVALWGRSVCIVRSCWEVGLDCWRNAHARFMVARLVMAALGRGQDVAVMEFEDPPAELLDLLEEEATSSC
ncbi:hypothetical protein V6N12_063025 [Hibiscus sabdariffa]|uniref:Reverse transcriptase zinc-binding domain-containing protein n=1 Tax=Hibiscus sabdariffa TaxID=183260 RepID=A0ABR2FAJ2_9ROSI